MIKRLASMVVSVLLAAALFLAPAGSAEQEKLPVTSLDRLSQPGISIAVGLNTPVEVSLREDYPQAKLIPYSNIFLAYLDVAQGRVDACVNARREMEFAIEHGFEGVRLLEENYASNRIAVGISPVSPLAGLKDKLNAFIAELRANGILDDMYERWVIRSDETMPEIPEAENPAFTLRVGTTGTVMPYSYYVGTELTGYDIELARRFAGWLRAKLELKVYDFGEIIPAAEAGSIDCIMSNLFYTEEKEESIPFSDMLFNVEITAMVRDDGQAAPAAAKGSLAQLNGKRIGAATGATFDAIVLKALPEAEIVYLNTSADLIAALEAGKIDGFAVDEPVARQFCRENPRLAVVDEYMDTFEFGFMLPKTAEGKALLEELDAWLASLTADGGLEQVIEKWSDGPEEEKTLPDYEAFPAPKGILTLATEGDYMPLNYFSGNRIVGAEIDLAARFCEANGYGLEINVMNFDGIQPAVETGKADFAAAGITITDERRENVNFSVPYYVGGTVMVVLKDSLAQASGSGGPEYSRFSELSGRTVSMLTGAPFEELVRSKNPDVGAFTSFSSMPDMLLALQSGKTDAVLSNNAIAALAVSRNPDLALFPEELQGGVFGFAFARGNPWRDAWQEVIDALPREKVEAAWNKWTGADESAKVLPAQDWPGANGTVRVAFCDTVEPMSYIGGGGEPKGFDLEVLLMAARELDVRVEFAGMEFSAILSSVQSGKADIGAGSIIVTEERAQAVDFAEYHPAAFVLVVRAVKAGTAEAPGSEGFLDNIRSSFEKTFIREGRWRLFTDGVLTTLLIALLTILLGTLLGFSVFMLCRNGNAAANLVTRFCMWLIQGMPMVVLLMILFYVIFGSVAISGVAVAIMGFTLTFGASVFGLLKMGVGAMDKGQYEAAYALGYSNCRTFFRIILPQALPHVLPAYKGEIVGLIKATSIVGYIAVQDLTKMGDIVRSRTYEAFFPLIAITVIYFVLEGLIGFLVSRISVGFNPRRRKPTNILKGNELTAEAGGRTGRKKAEAAATAPQPSVQREKPMIRIEHLKKEYPNVTPLKDVSVEIRDGDVISVIGPSGTGKSTLLRCINQLEKPSSGRIWLEDLEITDPRCNINQVRRKMGMVFQNFNLFGHRTVIENIMMAPMDLLGLSWQEAYETGMRLLRTVGLAEKALNYPDELSGGQKQRIAIARALAMDPDVILLDEPTSALDPTMVGEVQAVIRDLAKSGKTMMIVTHEMSFAKAISNRVFYMDEGGIYEDGAPEQIFDHPLRENTRRFVRMLKVLELDIESRDYDFLGMAGRIEAWCSRNQVAPKTANHVQLVFEETMQLLVPALETPRVLAVCEYAAQTESAEWTLRYAGPRYDLTTAGDGLALAVLKGMTQRMEYTWDESAELPNRLQLVLR